AGEDRASRGIAGLKEYDVCSGMSQPAGHGQPRHAGADYEDIGLNHKEMDAPFELDRLPSATGLRFLSPALTKPRCGGNRSRGCQQSTLPSHQASPANHADGPVWRLFPSSCRTDELARADLRHLRFRKK